MRSERPDLTTVKAIITVLEESGLLNKFWAEIALAHLVTKNLSPHAGIGGSILDALWDLSRCSSVAHLRPIECKGTMTIISKQEHRRNLSDKGRAVFMVGYNLNRMLYRVYNPQTGLSHFSGDVTFEEAGFSSQAEQTRWRWLRQSWS